MAWLISDLITCIFTGRIGQAFKKGKRRVLSKNERRNQVSNHIFIFRLCASNGRLIGWLIDWLGFMPSVWLARRSIDWLIDWLIVWLLFPPLAQAKARKATVCYTPREAKGRIRTFGCPSHCHVRPDFRRKVHRAVAHPRSRWGRRDGRRTVDDHEVSDLQNQNFPPFIFVF